MHVPLRSECGCDAALGIGDGIALVHSSKEAAAPNMKQRRFVQNHKLLFYRGFGLRSIPESGSEGLAVRVRDLEYLATCGIRNYDSGG
jgi:hypothetical protein